MPNIGLLLANLPIFDNLPPRIPVSGSTSPPILSLRLEKILDQPSFLVKAPALYESFSNLLILAGA